MHHDLLKKASLFCQESMRWCAAESEQAIQKINQIVNLLVEDAGRVSHVTQETLDAFESMRDLVNLLAPVNADRNSANALAANLKGLAKSNQQINEYVTPLIETLQFQDRIAQNMDNLAKMNAIWLSFREKEQSPEGLKAWGEAMLKATTMASEREIIRSHIEGLPAEQKAAESVLFF
jgi:hypothetical protein